MSKKLDELKTEADRLGIAYYKTITAEKLEGKIAQFKSTLGEMETEEIEMEMETEEIEMEMETEEIEKEIVVEEIEKEIVVEEKPKTIPVKKVETAAAKKIRMRNEAIKLVRVRLTCMNPAKKNWPGEIFSVSNKILGTIKKYIPYDTTEDGYHVPHVIYEHLKDRQYQTFIRRKLANGQTAVTGKLVKEFSIEILPSLTQKELDKLATQQAMANSVK